MSEVTRSVKTTPFWTPRPRTDSTTANRRVFAGRRSRGREYRGFSKLRTRTALRGGIALLQDPTAVRVLNFEYPL